MSSEGDKPWRSSSPHGPLPQMGDELCLDQGDDEENNSNLGLDSASHAEPRARRTSFCYPAANEISLTAQLAHQ